MTALLIRNLDPHLKRQIQKHAREHGQSLSAAAKALIRQGLNAPKDKRKLGTIMKELIPDEFRGDDLIFEFQWDVPKPPDFE